MPKEPTLDTVLSGFYSTQTLNSNFQEIADAFENVISRDGSTPNNMEADLDMDGNRVINSADPIDNSDLVTLGYVNNLLTGSSTGIVDDAIVNGVTARAPSQNAVFDALALKSNTSHTHTSGDITNFDEAVQDAVGGILTDSSEIDFTYSGATPSITAALIAGSIDETKLDTSVNASLDLADTSAQPGDNVSIFTNDAGYITSVSGGDHGTLSGLADDDHTQYHNDSRALTWLGTRSTTDLPEGTNLYYTDERAQDAVGGIFVDSPEIDFTYNAGTPSITASIVAGSIDETKLDASVNASLDLADTALQANQTITLSSDVTGSGSTAITATIANDAVTYAKMQNAAGGTVLGRAGTGTGDMAEIQATAANQVLRVNSAGTLLAWGAINLASTNAVSGTLPVGNGGTGQTTYTNGQLLIGNTTGNTLTKATLTEGEGIDITNGTGSITIAGEDATSSNKGIASFDADHFSVTSGAVSLTTQMETRSVEIEVFTDSASVTTGDNKKKLLIPSSVNGMNLVRATATVGTAGTTNATTIMIHNLTQAADMLSATISIASGGTIATPGTVDTANDDVATDDVLRIDVDSVSTTAPLGLRVVLEFRLP